MHQGGKLARVSQVDGACWERDAALGGLGGRKRGGLRRPPLLRRLLLLRQGLLLPRGPKPMPELPLERPGGGLRGLRNVVVGKLRGRHGKGGRLLEAVARQEWWARRSVAET